ncbi:MAG: HAD family hydrolase [Candidatus Pacearchaeota archaeon]
MKLINLFSIFKKRILRLYFLINVKCLIWDVDGTLWKSHFVSEKIKEGYISFSIKYSNKDPSYVRNAFLKSDNWLNTTMLITGIKDEILIIREVESSVKKYLYLSRNRPLVDWVNSLKFKKNIVLTNSTKEITLKTLKKIGFKCDDFGRIIFFDDIITIEDTNSLKPDLNSFKYILSKTKLKPKKHLMIGDSLYHDLIPAKELGMKAIHIDKFEILFQR